MNKRIFTGNYEECKAGNLISISGDRGRKVGFVGIELKYSVKVRDIKIDENLNIEENKRPEYIRDILEDVIAKSKEAEFTDAKEF